jgi:hypothetical protein
MKAMVPPCAACESDLRRERGEWTCVQPGCPLYGQVQLVIWPKPVASPKREPHK